MSRFALNRSFMEEILHILNDIRPGRDFSGAVNFFEQGMLDSLDLTTLIGELESRYGVFIDVDEMAADNFCNLPAIKTVLARKGVSL